MCQQATMIECLTAPIAFLCPRRGRSRGVLGGEVGVLGAGGGQRGLVSAQSSHLEPLRVRARAAFAGRLVVAGAQPGPRGQLPGGREDRVMSAPISATIDLGGAPLDAGDRAQQLNGRRERARSARRSLGQTCAICSSRKSMCARIAPTSSACMRVEAALQRLAQRRDLLAQPALGQLGQHLGVGRPGDERVEHRAARDAEDVRRDAVELDAGVLQHLVQPVGLPRALRICALR